MWKKFKIYLIQKVYFWSEKAVCSTRLCTNRCFFAIQGGGGSLMTSYYLILWHLICFFSIFISCSVIWVDIQTGIITTFLFFSIRIRLVLSGPAGPFCVWGIFRPLQNLYQVYVKKRWEKQNWWSITETSYAATNFRPIHLKSFPYFSTINNLRSHGSV